jgi:hypothetical protein
MGFLLGCLALFAFGLGLSVALYCTLPVILLLAVLTGAVVSNGDGGSSDSAILFVVAGLLFYVGLIVGGLQSIDWAAAWSVVAPYVVR